MTTSGPNAEPRDIVGVCVVHFRAPGSLDRALGSLIPALGSLAFHVVVTDNSGELESDACRNAVGECARDLTVLRPATNRGFAAGINAAAEVCLQKGATVLVVMSHETVWTPGSLEALVRTATAGPADEPRLVGPLLAELDTDTVFSAGGSLSRFWWFVRHVGRGQPVETLRGTGVVDVAWLDGAAVVVGAETWRKLGRLDERFFVYFEDVEYGLRTRQHGGRVQCDRRYVAYQTPGDPRITLTGPGRLRLAWRSRNPLQVLGYGTWILCRLAAALLTGAVTKSDALLMIRRSIVGPESRTTNE